MFDFKKIESFAPFCISCLGRAVGRVGFGLDNRERGLEVLNQFELQEDTDPVSYKHLTLPTKCSV